MYFNSAVFFWFLGAFLLLHFLLRGSLAGRNWLIVGASYFFYGWWDWRFLSLLLLSSLVDFFVGQALAAGKPENRRRWLGLSLGVNLGVLGFFKYFDFFSESVAGGLEALGFEASLPLLGVVLPVGISFYTFQSLGYTIDVYRGRLRPTRDLGAFLAYISFFPQLVAGPIERATNLLPQFTSTRPITKDRLEAGVWLILWGLFKKVVIADNLAYLVDLVYGDGAAAGPIVLLATVAFGFQIYCDFSGYSDIARGVASLLGVQLMVNFNLPYFATSPSDFWRRWHISLSTWFRDYLYIPLGGNRCSAARYRFNLLLTMLLAGLWHGAGWNFLLWGLWHGALLGVIRARTPEDSRWSKGWGWASTMALVFYGWLLFRAQSLEQIVQFTWNVWEPAVPVWLGSYLVSLGLFLLPLAVIEIWQKLAADAMPALQLRPGYRWAIHGTMLYAILLFGETRGTAFIYFQF